MVLCQYAGSERSEMSHETHAYKCIVYTFSLFSLLFALIPFSFPFFHFCLFLSRRSPFLSTGIFFLSYISGNGNRISIYLPWTWCILKSIRSHTSMHLKWAFILTSNMCLFSDVLVPYSLLFYWHSFWLGTSTIVKFFPKNA